VETNSLKGHSNETSEWLTGPRLSRRLAKAIGDFASPRQYGRTIGWRFRVNRRDNRETRCCCTPDKNLLLRGPVDHSVPILAVKVLNGNMKSVSVQVLHGPRILTLRLVSNGAAGLPLDLFPVFRSKKNIPGRWPLFLHGPAFCDQNQLPRRTVECVPAIRLRQAGEFCSNFGTESTPQPGPFAFPVENENIVFVGLGDGSLPPTTNWKKMASEPSQLFAALGDSDCWSELQKGRLRWSDEYPFIQAVSVGWRSVVGFTRRRKLCGILSWRLKRGNLGGPDPGSAPSTRTMLMAYILENVIAGKGRIRSQKLMDGLRLAEGTLVDRCEERVRCERRFLNV